MKRMLWLNRKLSTVSKDVTSVLEITSTKPVGVIKTVKGWIKAIRKKKKTNFIDVSDGSSNTYLQVVLNKSLSNALKYGSSVDVTGKVQVNPTGQVELVAGEINVIGTCDVTDNYPFTPNQKQSYDCYRQHLHFRPQIEYFTSLLRFRNAATLRINEYFNEQGFLGIHTPIITSNDCEGAGEIFTVNVHSEKLIQYMKKKDVTSENAFFNRPAFLTVSGQLHLEAVTRSICKVYTFNPTFRAENSKSRLHLSEFYMIEAEEAFVTDIKVILERIENFLKQVTSFLVSKHPSEIEFMLKHSETDSAQHMKMLENLIVKPFTVMTFDEAKLIIDNNRDKISKSKSKNPYSFTKEEELFLVTNNDNIPIFVIDWPKYEKPFYMKECAENNNLVKGVDLLVPNVGELCGGSLREDNYEILKSKLINLKLLDTMEWYLDLRKFGNVPTAGFGLGFERFLQLLLNVQNIKDTIPFPRWPHSLKL